MGVMEKLSNLTNSMNVSANAGSRRKMENIFFNFKTGANRVRLVGSFLEIRTHYIAPNKALHNEGFVTPEAIVNKEILSMINCSNWDFQTETWKKEKTCPICKIRDLLYKQLKNPALTENDKKKINTTIENAKARRALKWNIIDRNDPYAIEVSESGEKKKVLSYKIATIGTEASRDIDAIFKQVGFDITDEKDGIDIDIVKDESTGRVTYSAKVVISGITVVRTPLTDEEKKLEQHNLVSVCGRQTDVDKIERALRPEYRELLDKALSAPVVVAAKTPTTVSDGKTPFCFGEYDKSNAECNTPCECRTNCQEEQNIRKAEKE